MIVLYRLLYVIRIRSSVKCFTEEMNLIFENICGYELQHFIPAYLMKRIMKSKGAGMKPSFVLYFHEKHAGIIRVLQFIPSFIFKNEINFWLYFQST